MGSPRRSEDLKGVLRERQLRVHNRLVADVTEPRAEGTGLFWLAGMANGVRFFAPPYWKIEQCAKRAAPNPYYQAK